MRKAKLVESVLSALLILSLTFIYYQWKTIESNEETEQAFLSRHMSFLGADFIAANICLENILTGQWDRGVQFGRAYEALMDASERAREPLIPGNYQAWSIIGASLEQSASIIGNLSNKDNMDENDTAQLNNIKELLDVYIDMMRKSNANTGFIDEQSMLKAERAAKQFNQQ